MNAFLLSQKTIVLLARKFCQKKLRDQGLHRLYVMQIARPPEESIKLKIAFTGAAAFLYITHVVLKRMFDLTQQVIISVYHSYESLLDDVSGSGRLLITEIMLVLCGQSWSAMAENPSKGDDHARLPSDLI